MIRPPFSPSPHHRFTLFRRLHTPPPPLSPTTITTTTATATDDGDTINTSCSNRNIIVIMGATGAGKSRLSIDLATRFFKNAEIINSDKMQVYRGLDITTNKITMPERKNVPHHLLGSFDPTQSVITPHDYRIHASDAISDVLSRRGLPLLVGGSNSFIYSLLTKQSNPHSDIFNTNSDVFNTNYGNSQLQLLNRNEIKNLVTPELRFRCCFIWVDVGYSVLNRYLTKRVDEMLESGMVDELEEFFGSGEYLRVKRSGLGQAIGVPELEGYFTGGELGKNYDEYCEGVKRIKENTIELAKRQVGKIVRLKEGGWDLQRVDATEVFRVMMAESGGGGGGTVAELWEELVVKTSVKIVKEFL